MKLSKESQAYKNKLDYIHRYNSKYRKFYFMLDPDKDKELIDLLSRSKSKAQLIREMFETYKKGI